MPSTSGTPGQKAGSVKYSVSQNRATRLRVVFHDYRRTLKEFELLLIEVLLVLGVLAVIWWYIPSEFHQPMLAPAKPTVTEAAQ